MNKRPSVLAFMVLFAALSVMFWLPWLKETGFVEDFDFLYRGNFYDVRQLVVEFHPFKRYSRQYRPLSETAYYAVMVKTFGLNFLPWKICSTALHGAIAGTLVTLLIHLKVNIWIAALSGVSIVFHPSISWLIYDFTTINEPLTVFIILLAILRRIKSPGKSVNAVELLLCTLAVMSKEYAVMLPPVLLSFALSVRRLKRTDFLLALPVILAFAAIRSSTLQESMTSFNKTGSYIIRNISIRLGLLFGGPPHGPEAEWWPILIIVLLTVFYLMVRKHWLCSADLKESYKNKKNSGNNIGFIIIKDKVSILFLLVGLFALPALPVKDPVQSAAVYSTVVLGIPAIMIMVYEISKNIFSERTACLSIAIIAIFYSGLAFSRQSSERLMWTASMNGNAVLLKAASVLPEDVGEVIVDIDFGFMKGTLSPEKLSSAISVSLDKHDINAWRLDDKVVFPQSLPSSEVYVLGIIDGKPADVTSEKLEDARKLSNEVRQCIEMREDENQIIEDALICPVDPEASVWWVEYNGEKYRNCSVHGNLWDRKGVIYRLNRMRNR